MICPVCDKQASSFVRYAFTRQGVSITQNMRGFLTCQHCGTLLRVVHYGKQVWVLFFLAILVLTVFVILHRKIAALAGTGLFTILWVGLAAVIMYSFTGGLWKYGLPRKADECTSPPVP